MKTYIASLVCIFCCWCSFGLAQSWQLSLHTGHAAPVYSVDQSLQSGLIASGGIDNSLKVLDSFSGKVLMDVYTGLNAITCVRFSPTQHIVATAHANGLIQLWDVKKCEKAGELKGHKGKVNTLVFHAKKNLLLSGGKDGKIKVWNLNTNKCAQTLETQSAVTALAAFSDKSVIVSAGPDHHIRLWNQTTGAQLDALPFDNVQALALDTEGKFIVGGNAKGAITVWDAAGLEELYTTEKHFKGITEIRFNPAGTHFASASADQGVIIWKVGELEPFRKFVGHLDAVTGITFSADGQFLTSCSKDRSVKLWSVEAARLLGSLEARKENVPTVCFSPDGSYILHGNQYGKIQLWHRGRGTVLRAFDWHQKSVNQVCFSRYGKFIAGVGADGKLGVWEARTGYTVQEMQASSEALYALAFDPDRQWVATAGKDRSIRLWDLDNGKTNAVFTGHMGSVYALAVSPDGQYLVSAGKGSTVYMWDIENQKLMTSWVADQSDIRSLHYSRNGKYILTGSKKGKVKVWNAQSQELVNQFMAHRNAICALDMNKEGNHILTGSRDGQLKIWGVSSGKCVKKLEGHRWGVNSASFSSGGKQVISAAQGGYIKIWNAQKGEEVLSLTLFNKGEDYVVTTPTHDYDGTALGMAYIHAVEGMTATRVTPKTDPDYRPGLLGEALRQSLTPFVAPEAEPVQVAMRGEEATPLAFDIQKPRITMGEVPRKGHYTFEFRLKNMSNKEDAHKVRVMFELPDDGVFPSRGKGFFVGGLPAKELSNPIQFRFFINAKYNKETVPIVVKIQEGHQIVTIDTAELVFNSVYQSRKDYAVIFAINEYESGEWGEANAKVMEQSDALQSILEQRYGYEVEVYANPSLETMKKVLEGYAKQEYSPEDQLMVAFLGQKHMPTFRGEEEIEDYVLAKNSEADEPSSYLRYAHVLGLLDRSRCEHILCLSDVKAKNMPNLVPPNTDVKMPKFVLESTQDFIRNQLQVASRLHLAISANRKQNYASFDAFLQALEGKGKRQGLLTLEELVQQLSEQTESKAWELSSFGNHQPDGTFLFIKQ